jgi:hypothetical protein
MGPSEQNGDGSKPIRWSAHILDGDDGEILMFDSLVLICFRRLLLMLLICS